ncbi:4Fe-4S ferredoxin iron-sulfur binding domain-containing protein [Clostridium aceticum]|uniref:4Fe-4S ferredoxin iron-sulfur binding domain-containing protein n=1 Tax=Clostridium aceticum TaxID=84022 RepID=A0A0D8IHD1_9CLOT|nr:4Fe-4S double cluster binding domain-containing protein [Clostridium aceticum]AKL94031.1 4Fe-4S ferredoxin iron-sulfur binding domain-containing protein [Clostridium aceticum]KJF28596.1 hypothetical protein TZ02_01395 [Clostridium aceticum]
MGDKAIFLKEELKEKTVDIGADLFGIADLTRAEAYMKKNYAEPYSNFPRAVSIGIFLPTKIIELLEQGPQQIYSHYYSVVNSKLDELGLLTCNFLYKAGYDAIPIPASQQFLNDPCKSAFSHRLAASLAGLGWIGKSCCLINEKVGPRLRLVTVLTNAPLECDAPVNNRCGSCTACQDACPPKAIKGEKFHHENPLSTMLEPEVCNDYFKKVKAQHGIGNCGKCLAACPWGKVTVSK